MASITTTSSNSPSQRSTTSNSSPATSELLLIASALNGSYADGNDKSPDSTTSESYITGGNNGNSSSPASYSRANSGESSEQSEPSTRLQYNSNLEAEQVPLGSNFLKMSPSSCPPGKSKDPNESVAGAETERAERTSSEPRRGSDQQSQQPDNFVNERKDHSKNRNVLTRGTPTEDDYEEDLPSISESSQSHSQSQSHVTDSNFHTPSSSLHNLAMHCEPEGPSQDNKQPSESSPNPNETKPEETQPEALSTPADAEINGNRVDSMEEIGIFIESPTTSTEQSFESETYNKHFNASPASELSVSVESTGSREDDFLTPATSNDNSSGKDNLLQPGNYNTKPTKKKMWYHVFTPSYKSRVGDFKKNFKELPSEERLIVDYSCAIQKDILVQGRMYVSQNYICFHANIFGWETQTLIRFKEITSITKEKTALVIPNAIQVSTENEKYFFTSFVTRDAAYLMVFKLWQSSLLDQGLSPKEIWKLVRASYGEELGIASEAETEDYLSIGPNMLVKAASVSTLISSTSEADDCRSMQIDMVCASEGSRKVSNESAHHHEKNEVLTNGIRRRIDLSDSSDSEGELEIRSTDKLILEIPKCPVDHGAQGKELVNTIIPCDIDTLFTMLFTASTFFLDFHTSRKTFDIVQSDWEENPDDSMIKTRKVSFTVTLTQVMGPKHSQLSETQVMLPESQPGRMYAIDIEAVNSGIPYADTFYVTTHYCMSRVSAQQSKLEIVSQVKYRKSIWGVTKSFIERNSWAGLTEFYNHLERALKEECTKSNLSPPVSPRPGTTTGPVRRARKKYPAPAIPGDLSAAAKIRTGSLGRSATAAAASIAAEVEASPLLPDGSNLVKVILTVLAGLLILNAFLYMKLTNLENSATGPSLFQVPRFALPESEMPQTHQEWLGLLQKQESLHRLELQKWHGILLSALKILKQAEDDLQSLKLHVATYNEEYGKNLKANPMFQENSPESNESPST